MSKRALITGIRGQDGAYLASLLLDKGYEVYGADRRSGEAEGWRLRELGIADRIHFVYMDLFELTNIIRILEKVQPDEVYNLAAQSFVSVSFDQPILTSEVNAIGTMRLLEAIRTVNPDIKFYQASSSEMFGKVEEFPQTLDTKFHPRSPYGISKLFAHWVTVNYRESYDLFACSGILYNHESPLRGMEFVTRKITDAVARIKFGLQEQLVLGNLEARRDWGYAKEYVEVMWRMLQQKEPDTYLVATGEAHSIKEFVELAFQKIHTTLFWEGEGVNTRGKDAKTGKTLVKVSRKFYRPAEIDVLRGDPAETRNKLHWKPSTSLDQLIDIMVQKDIERIQSEYLEKDYQSYKSIASSY